VVARTARSKRDLLTFADVRRKVTHEYDRGWQQIIAYEIGFVLVLPKMRGETMRAGSTDTYGVCRFLSIARREPVSASWEAVQRLRSRRSFAPIGSGNLPAERRYAQASD